MAGWVQLKETKTRRTLGFAREVGGGFVILAGCAFMERCHYRSDVVIPTGTVCRHVRARRTHPVARMVHVQGGRLCAFSVTLLHGCAVAA